MSARHGTSDERNSCHASRRAPRTRTSDSNNTSLSNPRIENRVSANKSAGPNKAEAGAGAGAGVGATGRSALISDLVAQLKRGEITKSELFAKLQHLQGAAPTPPSTATPEASPGRSSQEDVHPTGTATPSIENPADSQGVAVGHTNGPVGQGAMAAGASFTGDVDAAADTATAGFFTANDRQVRGMSS